MTVRSANVVRALMDCLLPMALVASVVCSSAASAQVRIALVAPLSGSGAAYGTWMKQAAEDAVASINRSGGIGGQKVSLLVYDDECRPARAIEIAQRLVSQDNPIAVVGHCPNVAADVRKVYEGANVPLIIPHATLRDLKGGSSGSVFHLGAREDRQGEAALRLMQEDGSGRRIGFVHDGSRPALEVLDEVDRRGKVVFKVDVKEFGGDSGLADLARRHDADSILAAAALPDRLAASLRAVPSRLPVYVIGFPRAPVDSWERFWKLMGGAPNVRVVAPKDIDVKSRIASDALRSWTQRAGGSPSARRQPPAAYTSVVAAFELIHAQLTQIARQSPKTIVQAKQGQQALVRAIRSTSQPTSLGVVRSGETGELQVEYQLHAPNREWTPAGSEPRVLMAMKPAPAPAPAARAPAPAARAPAPAARAPAPDEAPRPAPARPQAVQRQPPPQPEPPTPPVQSQLVPGVYWNSWIEDNGDAQTSLSAGSAYDFAVDLSRYRYLEQSAEAAPKLIGEIRKARQRDDKKLVLRVRPLVAGTAIGWGAGMEREYLVEVNVERLAPPDEQGLLEDGVRLRTYWQGAIKLDRISELLSAARIRIPIVAAEAGCAQLILSIWDKAGAYPLDHLVHTLSVGPDDLCGIGAKARLHAGFSTLLEVMPSPGNPPRLPQAALHVFEVPKTNLRLRSVALLVDTALLDKPDQKAVHVWGLQGSVSEYVSHPGHLLKLIQAARESGDYSFVVNEMQSKLFTANPGSPGRKAFEVLQRIADESPGNPSILMRITSEDGRPAYLPLALLSSGQPPLLSKRFRIVHPAPEPSAALVLPCVDPWTFAIPETLEQFGEDPLKGVQSGWVASNRHGTLDAVRRWLRDAPAADDLARPLRGEGLVLLAHQGSGYIWFDQGVNRIDAAEVNRRFRPGSVALLSACSAANPSSGNDDWLNRINAQGIDTIFASPFPVPLDYGVWLTRHFVRAVHEARERKETPTILSLFETASDKAVESIGRDLPRDIRNEFIVIGDPEIRLCAQ